MLTKTRALSAGVVLFIATAAPAAASDVVMDWNAIALAATVAAGQGPVPQTRSMAIVQVAMHDAVNAVTKRYRTYLSHGTPPAGADAEAAAIAAAHTALVRLFPSQAATTLDGARAASLAAHGFSESDAGVTFGNGVGAAIFAHRASDGAAQAIFPYVAPGAGLPGIWVPVGTAPIVLPGWGKVTPWVLERGDQFRPDAPPSLESGRYTRDYQEVRELGSLNSTVRTDQQRQIAIFWNGSPSAIWNGVARQVIAARNLDLSSTARALALFYLAASDSGIACWDAKYTYNFWRPITAIRNAAADGNDQTIAEDNWEPLFPTHQHPEYPSGHSTNSGAMAAALALLFGDDPGVAIVATSPTNPGFVREWGTFSEGVQEVIEARIYSGFHYRTSDSVGARLGRQVAQYVVNHALQEIKSQQQ
jgi:membrane-associated phospholipid phosphatase